MQRGRPLAETLHITALGLWLGAVVMSGVAAARLFPLMKGLDPHLPGYAQYTGEHWRIAAGQPAAQIFLWTDIIQFVCATICIATMGVILFVSRMRLDRPSSIIRLVSLAAAICVLGFSSIYLAPRMQLNMRGHWEAAAVGRNDEAAKFQQIFSADHPLASKLMGATAITVLICLIASAWNATTSGIAPPPPRPRPAPSRYEESPLARSRR